VRVVFFGSGAFGVPTLEALNTAHDILAVVSQPDRPAGRKRVLTPTPISEWAAEHIAEIPLERPENINEPVALVRARSFDADAWVIIAYGQKLSDGLLADRFAINLHASRLPRWRGAAPINHAIIAGDTVTGNSVIGLASRMDAGAVYAHSERPIEHEQTAGELHDALSADGPALVLRVLDQLASNSLDPREQDESAIIIAPKLKKTDGTIDLSGSADTCRRRINGLSPWPAVTMTIKGEQLKVLCAKSWAFEGEQQAWEACRLIKDNDELAIACGTSSEPSVLVPIRVQAPGKKAVAWAEYARGKHLSPGDPAEGQPEDRSC